MQRPLAIAAVLGASMIAAALVYHARQLAQVSLRLEAMEQGTSVLDSRLEKFSGDLPVLVEQAANNAGRQAIHGMVDEVVQMPLSWLGAQANPGANGTLERGAWLYTPSGTSIERGAPWVRFDIPNPVINIEILPNLREMSASPDERRDTPPFDQVRVAGER